MNSVEAIKKAVEVGLGAAFVSRVAVQKELQLGLLSAVELEVTVLPLVWLAAPRWALKTVQSIQAVLPHLSQGAAESVLQTGKTARLLCRA
jgi:DNA-binding transcriptional LysR family regulator